jgi:hypothetical protein
MLWLYMPEKLIVLYHADAWCGHCKTFRPFWEKLKFIIDNSKSKDFKYMEHDADNGIVDKSPCDTNTKSSNTTKDDEKKVLKHKENVHGFPTVVLFEGSTTKEFKGERSIQKLIDFLGLKVDNFEEMECKANKYLEEKGINQEGGDGDEENGFEEYQEDGDGNFDQCGGSNKCEFKGGKSKVKNEKYYEMKYYKYKAKYIELKSRYNLT